MNRERKEERVKKSKRRWIILWRWRRWRRRRWRRGEWGCCSVDRESNRHVDAGSIPRCGKRFFCHSQLSVQTLLRCPYTPVCNSMHWICAHVKDPVVHVRVRWITGNIKTSSMHRGLSVRDSVTAGFPRGETLVGQNTCKEKKRTRRRKHPQL